MKTLKGATAGKNWRIVTGNWLMIGMGHFMGRPRLPKFMHFCCARGSSCHFAAIYSKTQQLGKFLCLRLLKRISVDFIWCIFVPICFVVISCKYVKHVSSARQTCGGNLLIKVINQAISLYFSSVWSSLAHLCLTAQRILVLFFFFPGFNFHGLRCNFFVPIASTLTAHATSFVLSVDTRV